MFRKALLLTAAACLLAAPAFAKTHATGETRLEMNIEGHTLLRTVNGQQEWAYQWPAVYFESHFRGDDVSLKFDDPSNNLNVIVDNRNLMIVRKPGTTTLDLHHLGRGAHTIRLEKRSETQYAVGAFEGFFVPSKTDALPTTHAVQFENAIIRLPDRARQIEFIGDSLTVGYGNTSAFTKCTPDEIFETTDAQEGFGPLTAKHFNADYQVNAFSGLGMVRNYDGKEHPKYHMPMLYDRAIFDDPTPAVQPDWKPQVIVIGIGGNDFSTDVRPDEPWHDLATLRADYVKTYTAFVQMIRAKNPGAFIILAVPSGRDEGYTGGTTDVFNAMKAGGDTKIDLVTLPELQGTGCNGHPNIHSDQDVASFYIDYINKHPDLWQGN